MTRIDLMIPNGTIKEYYRESDRAYRRRIRRQMSELRPLHDTLFSLLDTLFWLAVGSLAASAPVAFVTLFVRWWLCL